jgi:hypothetical protein
LSTQGIAVAPQSSAAVAEKTRYCYHCRKYHPENEMRRITTRGGLRWRCVHSIAAARQPAQQRQAYGHQTTNANRLENQRRMTYINQMSEQRRNAGG